MRGYYVCDLHASAGPGMCPRCMSTTLDNMRRSEMPGGYMRKINYEKDPRDAEIAKLKAEIDNWKAVRNKQRDDIELLRAELEALRPKPVVKVYYGRVVENPFPVGRINFSDHQAPSDTLKLTFHNGKLVSAEVVGDAE